MNRELFEPAPHIRNFDGRSYAGRKVPVEITIRDFPGRDREAYVFIRAMPDDQGVRDPISFLQGWLLSPPRAWFGAPPTELAIESVQLVDRSRGIYVDTYEQFFDAERKEMVRQYKTGGLVAQLSFEDPSRPEIEICFESGAEMSAPSTWQFPYPEEWYSDFFQAQGQEALQGGHYGSLEKAREAITGSPTDDLFGERYFPVICHDLKYGLEMRSIAEQAKGHSKPLVVKTDEGPMVLIGTRCKPHEVTGVIEDTYKAGGVVLKQSWNWE